MYKSKLNQEVKSALTADRNIQKRLTKFINKQYLKTSSGYIYRLAIQEWLDRNKARVGRPRGRRPKHA